MMKRTTALIAATAVAVPGALLLAAPAAHADVDRYGSIARGSWEFSVDREDGGFEVDLDVDRVAPGTTWRVVLRHDGKRVLARTLRADHEGDVDVDVWRPNTPGNDTFRFNLRNTRSGAKASSTITVR